MISRPYRRVLGFVSLFVLTALLATIALSASDAGGRFAFFERLGALLDTHRSSGETSYSRLVTEPLSPSISITGLGTPMTQNFDSLATTGTANAWTDNSTIPGLYAQFVATPANPTVYRADNGSSNTGAIYSYGSNASTDRAFGSLSSGTPGTIYYGFKFTNDTGLPISSLSVAYNGEQWRDGGAATPNAQSINFQYQVAAAGAITDANTPSTGWTGVSTLSFTSPVFANTGSGGVLDGNNAANRTAKSGTVNFPTLVAPGQEIWIRWEDINDAGNDHGLAIDDLSVTALLAKQFRSVQTGSWTSTSTWEESTDGGATFHAATSTPTAADGLVEIRAGHTVDASGQASGSLTIDGGGTLSIPGDFNFNVNGATLTNNGLITGGRVLMSGNGTIGQVTTGFAGNGTYSSGGRIETNSGMTANIAAGTTMTSTDATNNSLLQVDGNTVATLAGPLDVSAPVSNTNYEQIFVAGTLNGAGSIRTHGSIYFNFGPFGVPVEIVDGTALGGATFNAPVTIDNGATLFASSTFIFKSDLTVSSGATFDINSIEQQFSGNNATLTMAGMLANSGFTNRLIFEAPAGSTQTFTSSGHYSGNARVEFFDTGSTVNIGSGSTMTFDTATNAANLQIDSSTAVNFLGDLTVNAPADPANYVQIFVGSVISSGPGTLKTNGSINWSSGSSTFAVPVEMVSGQQTGAFIFGGNVTIDNGASYKLTSSQNFVGDLTIASGGTLDVNGINTTFTGNGKTFTNAGSLINSGPGNNVFYFQGDGGTTPNFTQHIATGLGTVANSITFEVFSTVKVVMDGDAQLSALQLDSGPNVFDLTNHTLKLSAPNSNQGNSPLYLGAVVGNFVTTGSTIEYDGTAPQILFVNGGTVPAYNNLTINNTAGASTPAAITVPGTLTLTKGVFTNGANLTLGNAAAIVRDTGSLSAVPTFGTSLNLTYTGPTAVNSGFELPTSSSILGNLTMNKSGGVTLTAPAVVNGVLTLTSGVINSSAVNNIEVLNSATTAVSGGSASSYVGGPLIRNLPTSLSGNSVYTFPIGASAYAPLELVNATTDGAASHLVTAQSFDGPTGGTPGAGLSGINSNRFWSASGPITGGQVRLFDPSGGLTVANRIGSSSTQNGSYASIGGTLSNGGIISDPVTSLNGFFVIGVTPTVTASTNGPLAFGNVTVGNASPAQSFTVSGANLQADILVTAPGQFQVSTNQFTGFSGQLTLNQAGGTVATTTIWTRYVPALVGGVAPSIVVSSTNANPQGVTVTGTGVAASCAAQPSGMVAWYRGEGNALDARGNANGRYLNPSGTNYVLTNSAESWTAAENEAVTRGGHLASVHSTAENNLLVSTFATGANATRPLWIGFTDQAVEGTFVWSDGSPVNYTNWEGGQPDDFQNNEDYATINWFGARGGAQDVWNDTPDAGSVAQGGNTDGPYFGIIKLNGGYNTGKVGSAFSFTGGNSVVAIPDSPALALSHSLTLDAWVNVSAYPAGGHVSMIVFRGDNRSFLDPYYLAVTDTGNARFHIENGSGTVVNLEAPIALNEFVHVTGTLDDASGAMTLYLNGVQAAQMTTAVRPFATLDNSQSPGLSLGNLQSGSALDQGFNGIVDEVEVFNRALAGSEIVGIYNAGSAGKCTLTGANGPIGWWPASGDARDITGNANNGTLGDGAGNGAPGFTVGKVGQAFDFNANGEYVSIPDSPAVRPTSVTLEAWAKLTNTFNAAPTILGKALAANNSDSYIVWVQGGSLHGLICQADANCFQLNGPAFTSNAWHHVAFTFDDPGVGTKTATLYLDGAAVANGTTALSIGYDTNPVLIGADFDAGQGGAHTLNWGGQIDEPSLYGRALSANEVESIFDAGIAGKYKSVLTPSGSNVSSNAGGDATVTFGSVGAPGPTQQIPIDPSLYPSLPLTPLGLYYDISSAADYTSPVKVCFHLPLVTTQAKFGTLRIYHFDGTNWNDVTDMAGGFDFANRMLCTANQATLSPFAIAAAAPTAAGVTISGRVLTPAGGGLRNASVVMTGTDGTTRRVMTNAFGNYTFTDVQSGGSYIMGVESRRYRYGTRVLSVTDALSDVDFTPIE